MSIVARDSRTVLEHVARGSGVTVLLPWQEGTAPEGVRVLPLLGVAPTVLHATTRAGDRRAVVRALIRVLRGFMAQPANPRRPAA